MLSLSGTTGHSDKKPSIVARSRLSRAPTMSSIAVTCESAHGSARRSTYLMAPRCLVTRRLGYCCRSRTAYDHFVHGWNQPWSSRRRRSMYSTLSAMSSRSFHMPAKGESPMERNFPEGASTGTYTSTTVPSLIGTSWRGLKTPFSYFAGMVMVLSPVYSVTSLFTLGYPSVSEDDWNHEQWLSLRRL